MRTHNLTRLFVSALLGAGLQMWALGAGSARAAEGKSNACGCYKDAAGLCYCERKAKCGCPGECEPKGCEEKRAKEIEKEIQNETHKAEEAERRQERGGAAKEEPAREAPAKEAPAKEAPRKEAPARVHKMSAAQRRELGRLLDLYLAEHPESRARTLGQARAEMAGEAGSGP